MSRPERRLAYGPGAAVGPAVLAVALMAVGPVPLPHAAAADAGSLPVMTQTLVFGQGCVAPSTSDNKLTPWPQAYLRPDHAWQLTEGSGVTVGVVDTGIDPGSAVLSGRLTVGPNVTGGANANTDCVGHGTFVAGLIGARQTSGVGFAGIAPQSRILAVTATDQFGATTADWVAAGIRAAVDGGARVVAVPLAVATPSDGLANAVQYATAHRALVVAPSTVDGQQQSGAVYPANYPNVLSVADIGPNGAPPQTKVAGARVDLLAPGDSVMSVGPGGTGYFTGTGPSFAVAFVAGTAALVLAYRPDLTPAQLAHRLETTAYHSGGALPNANLGFGSVDPEAAVAQLLPEENGATLHAAAATPVVIPPPADNLGWPVALLVASVAGAVVLLVAFAAVVIPRGRRRNWRPGGANSPPSDPNPGNGHLI